jgi:TonB-linked SusC/RagA family outer membrane protein
MKKTGIILIFLTVFAATMQGQSKILNKKVRIENREGTIGSLLDEISKKGGFVFSYSQDIPQEKLVRLKYNRQTVQQFLDEIFDGEIYCIEFGKKILIRKKQAIPEVYTVSGKVIDSGSGEPVTGATVIIPGTDPLVGSVSDENGVFRINVPLGMDVIQISCIGYLKRDLSTEQLIPGDIKLTPASQEISEVVVYDYILPVEKESGVALSYINAEMIDRIQGASIENMLIGAAPGVHAVRNSGMPGSSFQVKVRGTSSLINSDPVYYLDGIPLQIAMLNAVSPHDIRSVEIYKDASSTARYGARAGNGAIFLHSKEGNSEELRVNLDYHIGRQVVSKKPDLMNTGDFLDYFKQVRPDDEKFDKLDSIYRIDWMDLMFHPAKTEDCHLTITGGNERSDYYLGTGFFNQASIIKELKLKRYSFKLGSNHRINQKKWKISQHINFAHISYEGLKEGCFLNDQNNPILASMCMLPITPPHDSILDVFFMLKAPDGSSTQISNHDIQYLDMELTNNKRKNYTIFGNLTSRIDLTRNLGLQTTFGYELFYQNNISNNRTLPVNVTLKYNPVHENGYRVLDLGMYFQNYLHYEEILADRHRVGASVGFEYGQNENEWIPVSQRISNLATGMKTSTNLSVQELRNSVGSRDRALIGLLSYVYKERYILHGSLKREVISFDADSAREKYANVYPAISLGWIFLNRYPSAPGFLRYGKVRYAYGMAGNSPRLDYSFHARFMRHMAYVYSFNSSGTITNSAAQRQTNENFYQETISAHNLGIELGFHQNRLFMSGDLFYNHLHRGERSLFKPPLEYVGQLYLKDLFGIVQLPLADVENYGIEGQLIYKNTGRWFRWDISLNFTHLRNRINDVEDQIRSSATDPITVNLKGETAGSFYGYKIERLFTEADCPSPGEPVTNQPYITDKDGRRVYAQPYARAGDYKFMDINGDSRIDRYDKTVIGNPNPDLSFGLFINASHKQFDLAMFWQGTYGNEIYNATRLWLYNPYGSSNWTTDILNSYRSPQYNNAGEMTHPGLTDTDLHRFDYYAENKNLRVSDFYIEDGSYLRLKNVQLGYTINPDLTKRIHMKNFRIYIAAQNLLTFTRYTGLDPEVGGWGIDCGIYPQPRVWYAGVNIGF